jgi:hypothetical protein
MKALTRALERRGYVLTTGYGVGVLDPEIAAIYDMDVRRAMRLPSDADTAYTVKYFIGPMQFPAGSADTVDAALTLEENMLARILLHDTGDAFRLMFVVPEDGRVVAGLALANIYTIPIAPRFAAGRGHHQDSERALRAALLPAKLYYPWNIPELDTPWPAHAAATTRESTARSA